MSTTYWTCVTCGEQWPASTIIEAYKKHQRAAKVHPGEGCKKSTDES